MRLHLGVGRFFLVHDGEEHKAVAKQHHDGRQSDATAREDVGIDVLGRTDLPQGQIAGTRQGFRNGAEQRVFGLKHLSLQGLQLLTVGLFDGKLAFGQCLERFLVEAVVAFEHVGVVAASATHEGETKDDDHHAGKEQQVVAAAECKFERGFLHGHVNGIAANIALRGAGG